MQAQASLQTVKYLETAKKKKKKERTNKQDRDRLQVPVIVLRKFKRIIQLPFPLNSSENLRLINSLKFGRSLMKNDTFHCRNDDVYVCMSVFLYL